MILSYLIIATLTGLSGWLALVARNRWKSGKQIDFVFPACASVYILIIDLAFVAGVLLG